MLCPSVLNGIATTLNWSPLVLSIPNAEETIFSTLYITSSETVPFITTAAVNFFICPPLETVFVSVFPSSYSIFSSLDDDLSLFGEEVVVILLSTGEPVEFSLNDEFWLLLSVFITLSGFITNSFFSTVS